MTGKLQNMPEAAIKAFPYEKKFYVKDLIKDPPAGIEVWLKKQKPDDVIYIGRDENGQDQFEKIHSK